MDNHHYTYRVEWCAERQEYTARCLEISGLWAAAPTAQHALAQLQTDVDEDLRAYDDGYGGRPPIPLTEQNFSGRFLVRTSRALHARLVIEAAEVFTSGSRAKDQHGSRSAVDR